MVDYNKRQDVTIEEFKECVETCLPNLHTLHDELQRGNSINKAACKKILDNLHTKYIPNNLELFLWKSIGNVEEIVETATCTCGKIGMFNKAKVTYSACCAEHAKDFRLKRSVQSTIKKYGVAYNLQNKDTHKKTLEKWDGKSPFSNAENQKKAKETIKERYGVENAMQVKEFQEKSQETRLEKYGNKFGDINKRKETMKERYGVEYFSQSDQFKQLWPSNGGGDEFNKKIREKEYATKKLNNSFNYSSEEVEILKLLQEKFGNEVKDQYMEDRYPYKCDFYIPSLDLFIEYQGMWTHGPHPFDKNNIEDIKLVNKWKASADENNFKGRSKNFYNLAIHNWTVLDVKKREVAKQNNLKYLEFFNMKDFTDWLEKWK